MAMMSKAFTLKLIKNILHLMVVFDVHKHMHHCIGSLLLMLINRINSKNNNKNAINDFIYFTIFLLLLFSTHSKV